MAGTLLSRRDLDFLLYEWLDVELLTKRERFAEHSRDTFDAVLDLAEQVATEQFAPHNKKSDANEPTFDGEQVHLIPEIKRALAVYASAGLISASMDESVGGMQLPQVVAGAAMGFLQAATVGTSSYPFLTIGNANLTLYCGRLLDEKGTAESAQDRDNAHTLLEVLTPIAKSWPSQWCLEANNLAIQVLGGYGYTRDYDVEQHYRDNRLNPIHEGTHGIQGLDLLGRKMVMNGGAGLTALAATIGRTVAQADGELAAYAEALQSTTDRIVTTTGRLWESGDPGVALANSSVYLEVVGHVVIAWLWLEQALAARGREGDFYDGKRAAAQFFFRYELPRTGPQLNLLDSLDRTTLDMQGAWF